MDISEYEKDNTKNCLLKSSVPCLTKNEPCWLGIDEAGRGPVLGPMVYGICYSPISRKEEFTKNSFADSKTLTEEQREQLMEKINECSEWIGWMTDILSPAFISNAMLRRSKYNLNWISHDSAIGLVKAALQDGVQVEEVYVDTVGDPSKYQQKLQENLPGLKITVAKKADSLYPIVSAASICAKVCRDKAVKGWKFPETLDVDDIDNVSIGSGYPGDPQTVKFLSNPDPVFAFPQFVRFSWSTASKIIVKKCVAVSWEDDEDVEDQVSTPSVLSYFQRTANLPSQHHKPHKYFRERHLSPLTDI